MIKETNYRLFYNQFSELMVEHFHMMGSTCYLNSDGEVIRITLKQQTPLFVNFFWAKMNSKRKDELWKQLDEEQDITFYNTFLRDRLHSEIERFLLENIQTPIYV